MAACSKSRDFFLGASAEEFEAVLALYDRALRLKAESKSSKPDNVVKLDKWYQNELPKKIKSRGKDPHLTHEELVQTIKWKLARGKFRPNLVNMVQMNTPRVAIQETKKAFRNAIKRQDLQAAMAALCNLKGIGPTVASAVLAAGVPQMAPFMADECLLSMPDCDSSLDYTMKEYMKFVEVVNETVERLNKQGGQFDCHKVELAVWTHYVVNDLQPELLLDTLAACKKSAPVAAEPAAAEESGAAAGDANSQPDAAASENTNGSAEKPVSNGATNEDSLDSTATDDSSAGEVRNGGSGDKEEGASNGAAAANGNHVGENGVAADTNGTSKDEAKQASNPESEPSNLAPAAKDSSPPSTKESSPPSAVEAENADTNDSIKENVEATATKRAAEEDAAAAGEAPAEKKQKSADEEQQQPQQQQQQQLPAAVDASA